MSENGETVVSIHKSIFGMFDLPAWAIFAGQNLRSGQSFVGIDFAGNSKIEISVLAWVAGVRSLVTQREAEFVQAWDTGTGQGDFIPTGDPKPSFLKSGERIFLTKGKIFSTVAVHH